MTRATLMLGAAFVACGLAGCGDPYYGYSQAYNYPSYGYYQSYPSYGYYPAAYPRYGYRGDPYYSPYRDNVYGYTGGGSPQVTFQATLPRGTVP